MAVAVAKWVLLRGRRRGSQTDFRIQNSEFTVLRGRTRNDRGKQGRGDMTCWCSACRKQNRGGSQDEPPLTFFESVRRATDSRLDRSCRQVYALQTPYRRPSPGNRDVLQRIALENGSSLTQNAAVVKNAVVVAGRTTQTQAIRTLSD